MERKCNWGHGKKSGHGSVTGEWFHGLRQCMVYSRAWESYMPTFQNWLPGHMTTPTNLVTTPTNIVITPISYTTITLYTVHNTGSSQPEEKWLTVHSTASATSISACCWHQNAT